MKKEWWLVIGVVAIVLAVVVNTGNIGLGPRGGQVDGDVNGDGSFGLGDLMALISYLFGNGPSIDLRAADMNGDRAVDITDVSIMANLLSQSSPTAKSMVGPSPPCTSNCIDGDANGDGFLTISDPIYLLNALLVPGSPGLNCLGSSDANGDGVIDLADAIYLLNYLFSGGPDSAECFTSHGAEIGSCEINKDGTGYETPNGGPYCDAHGHCGIGFYKGYHARLVVFEDGYWEVSAMRDQQASSTYNVCGADICFRGRRLCFWFL
ncbi:hypothetical protein CXX78_02130 [Candidatus Parvarchaeota archaeon]|nr:MAG: hypothetical protein CXX78_02130 [Candidatus Parvarchaeota archaeon]